MLIYAEKDLGVDVGFLYVTRFSVKKGLTNIKWIFETFK